MENSNKIDIVFASVVYNSKTNKWDVKILANGKSKWIRGFATDYEADICAKSYLVTQIKTN